jgi:Carboxypeptidase regulatory-like domain
MLFANAYEPAAAQQRGPLQRIVQGKIATKENVAIPNAVVYLKDTHTLAVKSVFSDATGAYRFGQLSSNSDYELWAEVTGKKSSTRSISSLDSRKQFDIDLKIDTGK